MMLKVEKDMAKKKMAKKLGDDETAAIISYVQNKTCLWDENHPDFKRISVTRKLWKEIGTQLNISGDEAKCMWKNLREKFKKRLRKGLEENRGSESPKAASSFKFYNSMLFLKDGLHSEPANTTTPMTSNNTPVANHSEQHEENDNDFEEFNFDFLVPRTPDKSSEKPGPRSSKRKAISNGESRDRNQEQEEKKYIISPTIIHQDERKGNDDHHFLQSLMPYIQALDPVEKLELRSQMQNLVTASFKKHEVNKRSRLYQ